MWAGTRVWTQAWRYAETLVPCLVFLLQVPYIPLWQLYTSASVKMVLIYVTAEGLHSENSSATPTEQVEQNTYVRLCVLTLALNIRCTLLRYKNQENSRERVHLSEAKEKKIRRLNLQSTRRWSISVWLNRWLLISMVTCWSVLMCQVVIGAGSCEWVRGCRWSRWLHLIVGVRTLKSWERRRDHTGDHQL